MRAKIKIINSPSDLKNIFLRERAMRAHGGRSREFVALLDGEEVGFLSYEDWSDRSQGFIYEIFVLLNFRQQGIAESMLLHAENHAFLLGCKSVKLKPYALDQEPGTSRLISWYSKMGYLQSSDDPEVIEKRFSRSQA